MSWSKLFGRFGFSRLLTDTFYKLDWRKPNKTSVKSFIKRNKLIAYKLKSQGKIPIIRGVQDDKVMKSFKWVVANIEYERDINVHNTPEMWEDIDVILQNKKADCESMALLAIMIAIVNGVNPMQLYLVAGNVIQGGHSWLEYDADYQYEYRKSYILDPAYAPRNITKFNARILAINDKRYIKRWFKINCFTE